MRRRRPFWLRALAAIFAVWFPLVIGEPSLLQPCPTHGAAAHVSHTASAAAAHSHDQAPPNQHHDCTCISCCTAGGVAVVAPLAAEIIVSIALIDEPGVSPVAASLRPTAPDYSRPYTTGPPRV